MLRDLVLLLIVLMALAWAGESDRRDAEAYASVAAEIRLAAAEGRDVRLD